MIDESSIPQVPVTLPERCICGHKYHNHRHNDGDCLRVDCHCPAFVSPTTIRIRVQVPDVTWYQQMGILCDCGDIRFCTCGFVDIDMVELEL